MNSTQIYYFGMFSSLFLAITPYPQLYLTYKAKQANDISTFCLVLQIIAFTCFMTFGILSSQIFIVIPNVSLLVANLILISMKYYFMKRTIT
jgi:uncharacterized protein with PQ loop repeat